MKSTRSEYAVIESIKAGNRVRPRAVRITARESAWNVRRVLYAAAFLVIGAAAAPAVGQFIAIIRSI